MLRTEPTKRKNKVTHQKSIKKQRTSQSSSRSINEKERDLNNMAEEVKQIRNEFDELNNGVISLQLSTLQIAKALMQKFPVPPEFIETMNKIENSVMGNPQSRFAYTMQTQFMQQQSLLNNIGTPMQAEPELDVDYEKLELENVGKYLI